MGDIYDARSHGGFIQTRSLRWCVCRSKGFGSTQTNCEQWTQHNMQNILTCCGWSIQGMGRQLQFVNTFWIAKMGSMERRLRKLLRGLSQISDISNFIRLSIMKIMSFLHSFWEAIWIIEWLKAVVVLCSASTNFPAPRMLFIIDVVITGLML